MSLMMIATLAAFFVKGLCGFANTLVFTSILSFGFNNINITPLELMISSPSNFILVFRERQHIRWKVCLPLAALVLLGNIPGIFLLKYANTGFIKICFGWVIIAIGAQMLYRENHQSQARSSKAAMVFLGLLSGILCGLYGIGALMAAYVQRVTKNQHEFKANICIVFISENIFRFIMYIWTGIITLETVKTALMLVVPMLAGLFIGMKSSSILNEKVVKKIVIITLMLSGAALIINNM